MCVKRKSVKVCGTNENSKSIIDNFNNNNNNNNNQYKRIRNVNQYNNKLKDGKFTKNLTKILNRKKSCQKRSRERKEEELGKRIKKIVFNGKLNENWKLEEAIVL